MRANLVSMEVSGDEVLPFSKNDGVLSRQPRPRPSSMFCGRRERFAASAEERRVLSVREATTSDAANRAAADKTCS
jgi:hypothetical protein